MQEQRLGLVLGRAVSHEIGHYLLQTNTHATRGLMRARIAARIRRSALGDTPARSGCGDPYGHHRGQRPLSSETVRGFSYR